MNSHFIMIIIPQNPARDQIIFEIRLGNFWEGVCTLDSCTAGCGCMRNPTANNRESPRIAFSLRCLLDSVVSLLCRVPTLRLIGSAWPERQRGKCWKTRVAGFLLIKSW